MVALRNRVGLVGALAIGAGVLAGCGSEGGGPVIEDTTGGLTEDQIAFACDLGAEELSNLSDCGYQVCFSNVGVAVDTGKFAGDQAAFVDVTTSNNGPDGIITEYDKGIELLPAILIPREYDLRDSVNDAIDLERIAPRNGTTGEVYDDTCFTFVRPMNP